MFDKKTIEEFKVDVVLKGVRYHMELDYMTTQEFAEVILVLINYKSSVRDFGIVNVRTYEGSNTIEVDTTRPMNCYKLLKQLVRDYHDIKEVGKIKTLVCDRYELAEVLNVDFADDDEKFCDVQISIIE